MIDIIENQKQWRKEQNEEQAWWKRKKKNKYKASILNVHYSGNLLSKSEHVQKCYSLQETYQCRHFDFEEIIALMKKIGYE